MRPAAGRVGRCHPRRVAPLGPEVSTRGSEHRRKNQLAAEGLRARFHDLDPILTNTIRARSTHTAA